MSECRPHPHPHATLSPYMILYQQAYAHRDMGGSHIRTHTRTYKLSVSAYQKKKTTLAYILSLSLTQLRTHARTPHPRREPHRTASTTTGLGHGSPPVRWVVGVCVVCVCACGRCVVCVCVCVVCVRCVCGVCAVCVCVCGRCVCVCVCVCGLCVCVR